MKKILGLDLGTNSIGWAVVEKEDNANGIGHILMSGSRIIPMDAATMADYEKGNSQSQTSERTRLRSVRRLNERRKLRRQRLHRVLSVLGYLPRHYEACLDRYGNFKDDAEPKLAWCTDNNGKSVFLFQNSFSEMVAEIKKIHPEVKNVPCDWTLYYLRTKALHSKISKEELAWVLLSFLQKRGYYQLRGEEEETTAKIEEYASLKVLSIEDSGDKRGSRTWWNVHLEGGMIYKVALEKRPEWEGKTKDFIITTMLDKDGNYATDKDGNIKRSFRAPQDDDWNLIKVKTERNIETSGKTVGQFIYEALCATIDQKVRGSLVRTIERKYYKSELERILEIQIPYHSELTDRVKYAECVSALYPSNEVYRNSIAMRGFDYLLADDVIFYQRPLKSKKTQISECPYEYTEYVDKITGEVKKAGVKCISKSNPVFQEFRLWQFISNLRIYKRVYNENGRLEVNKDVTSKLLPSPEAYSALYDWLVSRATVSQEQLLKYCNVKTEEYRWNYVEDKKYPAGELRALLIGGFKKAGLSESLLTSETEKALWHLLYSISDKGELLKALATFARKRGWNEDSFVAAFGKTKPFASEYGAYSEKAICKLLPWMRMGKYSDKNMDAPQGLPLWEACYKVYGRHSEARDLQKWNSPHDIDIWLKNFRQHSLRNPIVEQVVTETLRVVRDIWSSVGNIDEIHLEMGRNLKQTAEQRKNENLRNMKNEQANMRAKMMLMAFLNPGMDVENVRPYSPAQQELFRIFEEHVIESQPKDDEMQMILQKFAQADAAKQPTPSEILRYRNWLEQGYRSPYTGEIIPLSKLFTPAYQIEHVIPQSVYFNNSYNNKVICETEVNQLKSNQLGMEFIQNHGGQIVQCGMGRKVRIFSTEEYQKFVEEHYKHNSKKMENLLLSEVPEEFTTRQLNDSRYISKLMLSLLSCIVREECEGVLEEEATSKNVITVTGQVTDRLKKDWGLNDVWNKIILPRFERMNKLTGRTDFVAVSANGHRIPQVPVELQRNFKKKRIDHRHHAMDAIAIACATRNMVNYLSNQSAGGTRHDLQRLLCEKHKQDSYGNYQWIVRKPWPEFTQDALLCLEKMLVSFKQNKRVINKTTNTYQVIGADGRKTTRKQTKGESWAIRKPLHKDTVYGNVNLCTVETVTLKVALDMVNRICHKKLRKHIESLKTLEYSNKEIEKLFKAKGAELFPDVNLKKIEVYYFSNDSENTRMIAVRKPLDASFKRATIEAVTDSGIRKILLKHLEQCDNDAKVAFSPDGITKMNDNIQALNDGVPHKPIYRVRVSEIQGNKFAVGRKGNRSTKYFEAAKGTNLYFAVYADEQGERSFETIAFNEVVERFKMGLGPCEETDAQGRKLLFTISPNDLVYLPTAEEVENGNVDLENIDRSRVYKMVSSSKKQCFFVPYYSANTIVQGEEFGSLNKIERSLTGEMIAKTCIPLKIDRLGKIKE